MTIEVRHYIDIAAVRQTLLDVYADARAPLLHLPNCRVETFAEVVDRHAAEPGFEAVIGYGQGEAEVIGTVASTGHGAPLLTMMVRDRVLRAVS